MGDTGRFGSQLFSVYLVSAVLSHGGFARAAEKTAVPPSPTRFTHAGAWVLGLEGLLDLRYSHSGRDTSWVDDDGNAMHTKNTSSSLWFAAFSPRVALDGFVIDHLSLGVTGGFSESNYTTETNTNGQSYWQSQTEHSINITPRVGFAYMFADGAGLWIRGGVGITSRWFDSAPVPQGVRGGSSAESYDLLFEVLGAFMVRRDIVICLGPSITKIVGSGGDGSPQPEDNPPSYGLALGAGLVL